MTFWLIIFQLIIYHAKLLLHTRDSRICMTLKMDEIKAFQGKKHKTCVKLASFICTARDMGDQKR